MCGNYNILLCQSINMRSQGSNKVECVCNDNDLNAIVIDLYVYTHTGVNIPYW